MLSDASPPIQNWAQENKLTIAPKKSTVTVFTPRTSPFNSHPSITINNSPVPLERNPMILGVVFDPLFAFSQHISIKTKASMRLQIMKMIPGTSWAHDKETLLLTYNRIIKPIGIYIPPVWYPAISWTNISKIQIIQNKALRISTVGFLKTDIQHLHSVVPGATSLRPPAMLGLQSIPVLSAPATSAGHSLPMAGSLVTHSSPTGHSSPWTQTYPSRTPPSDRRSQPHWPYGGERLHRH